jgi:hypothetical protein
MTDLLIESLLLVSLEFVDCLEAAFLVNKLRLATDKGKLTGILIEFYSLHYL